MYEKNAAIANTLKATRERRKGQMCKTYEMKIDFSHLSIEKKNVLRRLFLEAKWFHNHVLALDDLFNQDYRIDNVKVKLKDGTMEDRNLLLLTLLL